MPNYKMVDADALDGALLETAKAIREKGGTDEPIPWDKYKGFEQAVLAITGGGLNFKVVGGTTRPANPKENTIWINTEQEVTGLVFSIKEPAEPASGLVWIKLTEKVTSTALTALEGDGIRLFAYYATQHVNGAFAAKPAKIYQDGAWKDLWSGTLYDNGIIPDGFCGVVSSASHSNYPACTMEFQADKWYFYCPTGKSLSLRSAEKIDVTHFKTLHIDFSGSGFRFGLANTPLFYEDYAASAATGDTTVLDISSYTGEYYIATANYKSASTAALEGFVYKLWME